MDETVATVKVGDAALRRAFAARCAGLLHQGVDVVVDVVTTRQANLHDEIVDLVGAPALRASWVGGLCAVAYRPVVRELAPPRADVVGGRSVARG